MWRKIISWPLSNVLLILLVGGCAVGRTPPTVIVTPPLKQPEPQRPLIGGVITGLPAETLVRIRIHTFPDQEEVQYGTRPGNGSWESVLTEASGADYVVTAEAEGFISQPASYTIHLSGLTAYLVVDGQATTEEALHLDFHFIPAE